MAQNSGTGERMKSNQVPGVGGIVLLAVFAMGTSAQASTLSGASLSTDGSLSMADTGAGSIMQSGSGFSLPDLSFDTCSSDDCIESEDATAVLASGNGSGTAAASAAAPEPASFLLVGLTLAVLPLIRKRRR